MDSLKTNDPVLAEFLAEYPAGRYVGLQYTKKGVKRGGVVTGDDRVHYVINAGFRYDRLVSKSRDLLTGIDPALVTAQTGLPIWAVTAAKEELEASFAATLAGENSATTDAVYEPLVVDDEVVRGSRVYVGQCSTGSCACRNCTGDPRAPLPGTIYLQGLRVSSKVLVPAKFPTPPAKSSEKTQAKNALRSLLPISKYVSFVLEPGTDFILRASL